MRRSPAPWFFALAISLPWPRGQAANSAPSAARRLYVVTCDARMDEVDTVARRVARSVDLAKRAGPSFFPTEPGAPDGCLANQAAYLPATRIVYTVVPTTAREGDGGLRDYRVLGFRTPDGWLIDSLPGGLRRREPPSLRVAGGKLVIGGPSAPSLRRPDLTGVAPALATHYQLLETSGERGLARLFPRDPAGPALVVFDRRSGAAVTLAGVPPAGATHAHLAPGGDAVLIEAATGGPDGPSDGDLRLYDGVRGRLIRHFAAPSVKGFFFLAIAPNGVAVFHRAADYRFISLGRVFGDRPVERSDDEAGPWIFFGQP